jgi:hypothetical protein
MRKYRNARSDFAFLSNGNPTEVDAQRKFSEFPQHAPADYARRLPNDTHKKTVNFKFGTTSRKFSRIDPYE